MQYLIFLFTVLTLLISCKGQKQIEDSAGAKTQPQFGETVTELSNKIWTIYQDHNGHYWFGSNGVGVYLYDGNTLQLITTDDGLIDNTIRGVQEDHEGNIFIETPVGISRFDGKKFTNLKPIVSPENEWKLEEHDLWFNCNGNAKNVYRYDGVHLYELRLPKKDIDKVLGIDELMITYSPYTVFGIDKDREGNIWFGTVIAGAFRYDGESFLWVGEKELSRLEDGREPGVRSMIQDKDGNFWLSNILYRYQITSDSTYKKLAGIDFSDQRDSIEFSYYNAAIYDRENLWIAQYGGGVWKYDGSSTTYFPVKRNGNEALLISIYKDRKGTLWLGTDNDGVYQFNGSSFVKFTP